MTSTTVLEAIAEPTRRRILDAIRDGERSVGDLVEIIGMHQPGISRHLKVLRDAGLVEVRRDAQRRLYRLRAQPLMELDQWLEPYRLEWSNRLDNLERHLERTADGGLVRFERFLAYPIQEVWAAITLPERLGDWWPPMAAEITVDLREGGRIVFEWPDLDFPTMEFEITRVEAPTLLEHKHTSPGSWMRWELEETDEGTRLLATYSVPDIDMAIDRGDVVGLHYSLDRLDPALSGNPVGWDNDAFQKLLATYAQERLGNS
ncbi:metalloregulator ArsR/SmtB family transcription factor [Glutamicibacter ectropisis]|uniref:metalloregulator ArsR/SmtB family transcription factor n=1 Tax=Glutamicibacter ectropisis TaxID=3046593 RepID=UPI0031E98478